MSSRTSSSISLDRDAAHQRLLHELDCASQALTVDPEAFLWRARRIAELWCLLHWPDPQVPEQNSLDQLVEALWKRQLIREAQWVDLDSVRQSGNPGVHVRLHNKADQRRLTKTAATAITNLLPDLLKDLSEEDSGRMRWLLRELQQGGRPLPRNEEAEALGAQLRESQAQQQGLASELQRLRAELELRRAAQGSSSAPPGAMAPAAARTSAASAFRRALPWAAGLAGLAGVAAVLSLVDLPLGGSTGPQRAGQPPAPEPSLEAIQSLPSAAPVELRPSCPSEMELIPATSLKLGQPERPSWPPAVQARIEPFEEPAFCVDRLPQSWSDVLPRLGPTAAPCLQTRDDRGEEDPEAPGGCVSLDEARAACEARGAALPSIAQWEAMARQPGLWEGGVYREWVQDSFPPRIFHREGQMSAGMFRQPLRRRPARTDQEALWSWNQQNPKSRLNNLGFRCAARPTHGAGPTKAEAGAGAPTSAR